MKVLIDANVLLDLAMGREPFVEAAAAVIDAAQAGKLRAWMAWHTVSNVYYIFSSEKDDSDARTFLRDLLSFVDVVGGDADSARRALALDMADYEDALQSVCALNCGAELIVTRNTKDFRQSPIRAVSPEDILEMANL